MPYGIPTEESRKRLILVLNTKIHIYIIMKEKRELKGRPPKLKPQTNCVMVRFDDKEYAKFLSMYEKTRLSSRSAFTKARVFGEEFRVVSTNNPDSEYYTKLSDLHAQFRRIGVNYNQVTKELKFHFLQKKRWHFYIDWSSVLRSLLP